MSKRSASFSPSQKSWISLFLRILGGAALFWGLGFSIFYFYILSFSSIDDTTFTEGIVIFTGGTGRLSEGLELLDRKKAYRALISGVDTHVGVKDLTRISSIISKEFWRDVDIGHEASDTKGNAQEAATWVKNHGYKSIRLVTSYYHMPRSLLEVRRLMPHIQVIPYPVFPEGYKGNSPFSKLLLIGGAPFSPKYPFQHSLKSLFILGGEFNKLGVATLRALWG
jgi:uncharacterized SAM-binding protein YcdF (DUF218 family)